MRISLFLLLVLIVPPAIAAPALSPSDRDRLADGTTDRNDVLDQEDGFYVLLRNASSWAGDDFGGDAGAAVAPPPDYAFLKDKPEQARGNVYLIEGWLAYSDRWPTLVNHSDDKLLRAGDPAWGDQVTRWTVVTEKDNADATIIVLFNDPDAAMPVPETGSKVRIAARFHKLWMIRDTDGKPFTYATFIGGAAETTEEAGAGAATAAGPMSTLQAVGMAIFAVIVVFFFVRIAMRKFAGKAGTGHQLGDRIEEMRRKRERLEEAGVLEEDDAEDLPEDPIAALETLRQKHESE